MNTELIDKINNFILKQQKIYINRWETTPHGEIRQYGKKGGVFYFVNPDKSTEIESVRGILGLRQFNLLRMEAMSHNIRKPIADTFDFLDFYCKLAVRGKSMPSTKIDEMSQVLARKINYHIKLITDPDKGGTKEEIELANKLKPLIIKLRTHDRLEQVIAIDKLVNMEHTHEQTIIPQIFGAGPYSGRFQRSIRKILDYLRDNK